MRASRLRIGLAILGAAGAAAVTGSCNEAAGPVEFIPARLAVAPVFATSAARIIEIRSVRFMLHRTSDASLARDTVLQIAPGADSVALELNVVVATPNQTFELFLEMRDAAGTLVFTGGPILVTPATTGTPPVIEVPIRYVGVGANAASVSLVPASVGAAFGQVLVLEGIALDSAGRPIPGTPIEYTSLDPTLVAVPVPDSGRVVVGTQRGTARVMARLLTGQADTAAVLIQPVPVDLKAESGGGQTALVQTLLPQPLVARAVAADSNGVENVWVRFTKVLGSGVLSAESVLTDASGRASIQWTLGIEIGTQTVVATTGALPADTALFLAQAQAPVGTNLTILSGNAQQAQVGAQLAPLIVRATDGQGAPIAGDTIVWTVVAGNGTVTPDTTVTDANGDATATWFLGTAAGGGHQVRAELLGRPVAVLFTATALAGPPTQLAFTVHPTNVSVGALITPSPAVTAFDQFANPAVTFTGTIQLAILNNPGGGTLLGSASVPATTGTAVFPSLAIDAAGNGYTLEATATGLTPATSASFDVLPAGNVSWTNPAGGNWSNGANWSTGSPPGVLDTAVITLAGSYQVVLDVSDTVAALTLGGGTGAQTLVASGRTFGTAGRFRVASGGFADFTNSVVAGPGLLEIVLGGTFTAIGTTIDTDLDLQGLLDIGHTSAVTGTITTAVSSTFRVTGVNFANTLVTLATGFTSNGVIVLDEPTGTGRTVELAVGSGPIVNLGQILIGLVPGGNHVLSASVENQGFVLVQEPTTWNNGPTASLNQAAVHLEADVTLSQGAAESFVNGGSLVVFGAPTFSVVGGNYTQDPGGSTVGDGTVDLSGTTVSRFDGFISPQGTAVSTGILNFVGPLSLGTSTQILLDIGGTAPGVDHDQVNISGAATFAGTLTVLPIFGTQLTPGDRHTVLTFASRAGQFTTVSPFDLYPFTGTGVAFDTVWGGTDLEVVFDAQVVFSADSLSTQDPTYDGLFRVNAGGDVPQNVTVEGEFFDTYPRWEPGFKRLTYTSSNQLHVIDGFPFSQPDHLVGDANARRARFSPDGMRLAFECGAIGQGIIADVCVIADVTGATGTLNGIGDGTGKAWVTDSVNASLSGTPGFAWDPNSNRLVVARDSLDAQGLPHTNLYFVNFDGSGVTKIADLPAGQLITATIDVSPDGSRIAFDLTDLQTAIGEIWVINNDGTNLRQVSFPTAGSTDFHPVFSPDGQEIFLARLDGPLFDIHYAIADAAGGGERVVIAGSVDGDGGDLAEGHDWSPDGSRIVLLDFDVQLNANQVYVVPSSITSDAEYRAQRHLVGRTPASTLLFDKHPSWRP